MRSISIARARKAHPHRRPARHRAWVPSSWPIETLEARWVPSATVASPAVQMISATTTDSKSVTIEYQVNQPITAATPLSFGVYRSADGRFDASDSPVDSVTLVPPGVSGQAPTLDQGGGSATAVGTHTLTIALPGGLPPYPEKPYVLVVADPGSSTAMTDPAQTASFRVYTIGVVTHGGIQNTSWKHGPPWELQIAYWMKHEGFDAVIPYNWVDQSSTPGAAIQQSPRLARIILGTANRFPANSVVDLEIVGHSEGTVVNSYALYALQKEGLPSQLRAGYIEDTLLDPHAANNDIASGKQISYAGVLAPLAEMIVPHYQGEAKDPPAYFPSIVDQANVFYEHTAATAGGIYNLWGQVPVKSDGPTVHYYNLTAMGVTHSGKTGVALWYRNFIAPTLGQQAPLVQELQLNGQIDGARPIAATSPAQASIRTQMVTTSQPQFSGTAAPDSVVRLYLGPADRPSEIALAGVTHANAAGQWSLTPSRPLPTGQYRTVVSAFSRPLRTRPGLAVIPTQPLGRLVVQA